MAAKKTMRKQKKVNLAEFKAWLEGVEELQPEGWSPSKEQWVLIRAKINAITEPAPVIQQGAAPRPMAVNSPQQVPGFVPPPVTGGVPVGNVTTNQAPAPASATPRDKRGKTSDIDTTNGQYNSDFS